MLYSPIIDTKMPSFSFNNTNIIIKIPYTYNKAVGATEYNKFRLLVKTVTTGKIVFDDPLISSSYTDNIAQFTLSGDDIDKITINQYYKVQLAYGKNDEIGSWSNVGIIKCTDAIGIQINGLTSGNTINNNLLSYEGSYTNNDSSEKVYSYLFNIYDDLNNVYETSGELIHKSKNDSESTSSIDIWQPKKGLIPGKIYTIDYQIKTINGLIAKSLQYKISDSYAIAPPDWCNAKLKATLHQDDGYIELEMFSDTTLTGQFLISRASSKDNFQTWNIITKIHVAKHPDLVIWKDFTIEQGVKYLYSLRLYNDNNIKTVHIVNEGHAIQADFEDMFLFDGNRQLKLKFNPKVSSFKTTRLETKTDTIGGTYPHFFRNGNVAYKEFPISALISSLSDENELFINGCQNKEYPRSEGDKQKNFLPFRTQLIADNYVNERDFKLAVLNWLGDGNPKLFRSPGEGNYIVRLMNPSMSPNDTLGRMIHTVSCTAYECMECNFDNLKLMGYLKVDDVQDYLTRHVTVKLTNNNVIQSGVYYDPPTARIKVKDNRTMNNVIITNAIPKSTDFKDDDGNAVQADIDGTIVFTSPTRFIEIENENQLQLATLDFDYITTYGQATNGWNSWQALSTVGQPEEISLNGIYSNNLYKVENNNVILDLLNYSNANQGYLKWDPEEQYPAYYIDYLQYLKDNYSQVGEVSYLRIYNRKSEGREFNQDELDHISFNISVKSFNADIDYIKLQDGSRIYRDLGILSELKCGNGYSIDIVFLKKTVS